MKLAPEFEDWLVNAMEHGANDEFWKQNNIIDYPQQHQDIPVYLVGGWYDSWASNTTATYRALSQRLSSDVYLIMGPWIHGQQGSFEHGQVSFGEEAAIDDPLAWRLAWYDRWLKGNTSVIGQVEPFRTKVRVFVMGTGDGHKTEQGLLFHGGYWRDEHQWPLARTQSTNWYLHANGHLSTELPSEDGGSTSFEFDPRDPVPSIGGNISSGNDILVQGAWDQRGNEQIWNWPQPIPLSAATTWSCFRASRLRRISRSLGNWQSTCGCRPRRATRTSRPN